MPLPISILIVGWYKVRSNDEIPEEILRLCLYYGKIPSLTFYKAKNSHSPSVYQGRGCFRFCIDMYYFWNCATFSASFLWWLSAYLPSRWIRNPFGNRRLCAGHLLVSCVCRKECSRCLWTAELYSFPGVPSKFRCKWILLQASFPAGGTPEGWCNRSESVLLCCLPVLQKQVLLRILFLWSGSFLRSPSGVC